jgi:Right handed beta helix region
VRSDVHLGIPLTALLLVVVGLAGCSSPSPAPAAPASPPPVWDGTVGPRPVHPDCHGDAAAPRPGDVVCFTDDLDEPLTITVGGAADAPIVYSGDGGTTVPGIRAEADNIVIQGFVSNGADDTGIWAAGANVTVQDNTVTQVRYTRNDVDGIRFFGDGARVLHNVVRDLEGTDDVGDSHVDCMQSFATSRAGSQNVVIQGNRCEGIRAQCLMAEGPNVADGSGEGVSRNWLFRGNYCDAYAKAQSVAFQDVQNVTIADNEMAGEANKAFALGQGSTGAVVRNNKIGSGYGREVGFDDPSAQDGYQGPPAR